MLTQQQPTASETPATAPQPRALEDLIAYFEGNYVPLRDAKVSIMTHAFMYGTATFEGIRGYWNAEQGTLYVLFLREHMERIRNSAKMLLMEDLPSVDELASIVLETVRRNQFREDVYVRPSFYKSTKAIGVRLHHLEHELYVIATPFGNYIDIEKGVFDRIRSLPIWRPSAMVGYLLGDALRYTIASVVMLSVGLLLGYRPDGGFVGVVAGIALLLLFSFAFSWIWTMFGLMLRTEKSVMSVSMMVIFPLTFLSNVFVDPETLPAGLEAFVDVNPISILATASRGLMEGNAAASDIGIVLGAAAVLTAVFAPLTTRLYRRG